MSQKFTKLAVMQQVFLMMMCTMKYGVFVFFGVWQTIALIFTALLVPETRGVPIEKVDFACTCTALITSQTLCLGL